MELGRALEERGFESLWAPEHSHIPLSRRSPFPQGGDLPKKYYDVMDPFVTLAAAAAATTRLRVGTGVCLVVQRDPIQTAKAVASLDQVSGGRFLLGSGQGGTLKRCSTMEPIQVALQGDARAGRGDAGDLTKSKPEYDGEFVKFPPMMTWPARAEAASAGDRGRRLSYGARRAIAYGDGGCPTRAARVRRRDQLLPDFKKLVTESGRDPATLPITVFGVPEDRDLIKRYADAVAGPSGLQPEPREGRRGAAGARPVRRVDSLGLASPRRPARRCC